MKLTQRPDLPRRLTISFPIWGLFDTSESGMYHDLDKMVREHVERGFNCIRLEGGAGMTHDIRGNRLPPAYIHAPFGQYSTNRQIFVFGGEGPCDVLGRLIALCRACKEHGVYLILSSWYFLHTYWYVDDAIKKQIFSTRPEELFMTFAKYLDYILAELEERQLDDRLAFVELFNEVNAFPESFASFFGEEQSRFDYQAKHEEALAYLKIRHPQILFGLDCDTVTEEAIEQYPRNFDVFNGHNYFLWDVYRGTLEGDREICGDYFHNRLTPEDVMAAARSPLTPSIRGWSTRLANCNDLDMTKVPLMEQAIEERLAENKERYITSLKAYCDGFKRIHQLFPEAALVSGEGVTYCSHTGVHWEEKSEGYWEMVRLMMDSYKEAGLWGSVVKTCCGPEDPSWNLCAERLRWLNERFLKG